MLKINEIIFIKAIVEKLWWKHQVDENEVREALENSPRFFFVEKGHQQGENLYATLAQTHSGRYLKVFFVYKNNKQALIVSARDMTKTERRKYERK